MSVDWELCILHKEPPEFSTDEMVKAIRYLESADYLQNLTFNCSRGEDSEEKLDSPDAAVDWLQQGEPDWDRVRFKFDIGKFRTAEASDAAYPVFSRLVDDLMSASQVANFEGAASAVYTFSLCPGGLSFSMEGYQDNDVFVTDLQQRDCFSELLTGLTGAIGRPLHVMVLEYIEQSRIVPDEEILGKIKADIEEGMAKAGDYFRQMVEPALIEPEKRSIAQISDGRSFEYWIVTRPMEHQDKTIVAAYSNGGECWYFIMGEGDDADKIASAQYPLDWGGFVHMIERQL